jgi:heme exporter protein CcmD
MSNFADWFALQGYGVYVWPSYVLTALVVVLNVVWARSSARAARQAARRRLAMQKERHT